MRRSVSRSGSKVSISADRAIAALALLAPALLSACGDADLPSPPEERTAAQPRLTRPPAVPATNRTPEPAGSAPVAEGEGAAEVLKRYYAFIEARQYESARQLREKSSKGPSAEAFASNFERYADHHATVGTPSRVAEAEGWLYVEVPVQRYGKFKDGAAFGNAGTVTLRRRKTGEGAEWRIFTSG